MNPKPHRIVVYVTREEARVLRIKLLQKGKTITGWFRELMRKFLED